MRYSIFLFLVSFTFAGLLDIFGSDKPLKQKYCINDHTRNTYILIGPKVNKNFVKEKLKKLPFSPHEKLKVYVFDGKTYKEIFVSCMPVLSFKDLNSESGVKKILSDKIGKANDDFMLLKGNMFKLIKKQSIFDNGDFITALGVFSQNVEPFSRIIIFTNRVFKVEKNGDFKKSYVYLYTNNISKSNIKNVKKYFEIDNGFLRGINLNFVSDNMRKFKFIEIPLFMYVNEKKLKAKLYGWIDENNNLHEGWFEVYAVLKAPVKGKIVVNNNHLIKAKLKVIDNYFYKNFAIKGDEIRFNKNNGKYFNYNYIIDMNHDFEYRISR